MLLRFRFSNFRSFRDEQELSLVASPLSELPESVIERPAVPDGILPVAAIYGANASGKSNVLKAISFALRAVRDSFSRWPPNGPIPHLPFALDQTAKTKPSRFVLDFLCKGVRFQYGFAADSAFIHEEWLHTFPHGRQQHWFDRKRGSPIQFGRMMTGENRQIESMARSNSLFLSAAAQANHPTLSDLYGWFNGPAVDDTPPLFLLPASARLLQDKGELLQWIGKILGSADVGIAGLRVKKKHFKRNDSTIVSAMSSAFATMAPDQTRESFEQELRDSLVEFEFDHRSRVGAVALSEEQESDGTLAFLALLRPVLTSVRNGKLVLIDELDRSLHPLLAKQLIQIFNSGRANSGRGAQAIFNTHDTNLLGRDILRRDQIWFTEKDDSGASHLYPLTDFKPRKGEDLESGYLQGRYGAIPFLNSEAILKAFSDPPPERNGSVHGKVKKARKR